MQTAPFYVILESKYDKNRKGTIQQWHFKKNVPYAAQK
jgi:hypothetical protein